MAWLLKPVSRLPIVYSWPSSSCICHWHPIPRYTDARVHPRLGFRPRAQTVITEKVQTGVTEAVPLPGNTLRDDIELSVLIDVLPARVRALLQQHPQLSQLVEVVLDLGRPVLARFANTDQLLSTIPLTRQELQEITSKAGILPASCILAQLDFSVRVCQLLCPTLACAYTGQ